MRKSTETHREMVKLLAMRQLLCLFTTSEIKIVTSKIKQIFSDDASKNGISILVGSMNAVWSSNNSVKALCFF